MPQFVRTQRVESFLNRLSAGRRLYTLTGEGDQLHLARAGKWDPEIHTLGAYRPVEPLKSLLYHPRDYIGSLHQAKSSGKQDYPETIVIGVKNCDLSSLKIHDYVFRDAEPPDPFYVRARENTLLIACDCTDCRDVCFCPVVGEQPHAESGYDLNFSQLPAGLVVESGSDRGGALLASVSDLLEPASDEMLNERNRRRHALYDRVAAQAAEKGLERNSDFATAAENSFETDLWRRFAKDCVECGACNFCCCTCHCFLLSDGESSAGYGRTKQWDSCLYRNFARVGGGGNPRQHRADRLHNRFDKKFVFSPKCLEP